MLSVRLMPAKPDIGPTAAAGAAALGLLASLLATPVPAQAGEPAAACVVDRPPNSLWSLARCCAKDLSSDPDCRYHSKNDHFIVLKDNSPDKPHAYLIIPTTRMTGI